MLAELPNLNVADPEVAHVAGGPHDELKAARSLVSDLGNNGHLPDIRPDMSANNVDVDRNQRRYLNAGRNRNREQAVGKLGCAAPVNERCYPTVEVAGLPE